MLQDFRQFHIRLHAEWMKQNESLSFFPNKSVKLKVLSQIILHKSRYENNIRIYIYILLIRSVLHHWQHNTAAEMHHIYVLKWLWLSDFEQERVLRVCTYSGSSSDTETEPEGTGSTLGSPQRTLINRTKKNDAGLVEICTVTKWCFNFVTWKHRKHSFTITYFIKTVLHENLNRIWVALEAYFVKTLLRIIDCKSVYYNKFLHIITVDQNEETLKRSSVEKSLSIMDYYQHDMFSHLEKDSRRISQYNLLHKESSLDGKAGDRLSVSIKAARCLQLISFNS